VLELFKTVIRLNLPFDQVIYEAKNRTTKWVHVSHDPARARGAILVADFKADGSVATYRTITAQQAMALSERTSRSAMPVELDYEELPDEPAHESAAKARTPVPVPKWPKAQPRPAVRKKARKVAPAATPKTSPRKKKAAPVKKGKATRARPTRKVSPRRKGK
jgi:hypothetical protein